MKRPILFFLLLLLLAACDPPVMPPPVEGDPTLQQANGKPPQNGCHLQWNEKADFVLSGQIPEGTEVFWGATGGIPRPDKNDHLVMHYTAPGSSGKVTVHAKLLKDQNQREIPLDCTIQEQDGQSQPAPTQMITIVVPESTQTPVITPEPVLTGVATLTPTKTMIYATNTPEDPHGADGPHTATAVVPTSHSTSRPPTLEPTTQVPPSDTPEPPPTDTPPPPPPTNTPCRDNRDGCKK